jgi:hypothetical protein
MIAACAIDFLYGNHCAKTATGFSPNWPIPNRLNLLILFYLSIFQHTSSGSNDIVAAQKQRTEFIRQDGIE